MGGDGFFVNTTAAMEPASSIGSVLLNATPMALVDAVAVAGGRREDPSGIWDASAAATATTLDARQAFSPTQGTTSPPQWVDGVRRRQPLYVLVPITIIYAVIFLTGIVGNVSTCIIIAKNKHMHTATNYYLFNLAISDLILLVSGMPVEMHQTWSPYTYAFGEAFCVVQSFAAETSANATVLTITAFTVERYVAICHPLRSHTFSGLSRAVRLVVAAWVLAVCLAVPQAIQFGVIYPRAGDAGGGMEGAETHCTVKRVLVKHAFAISTCVVFVAPMTVITALYVLIGLRLRNSRLIPRRSSAGSLRSEERKAGGKNSQNHVIKMLVAVVVAFFICWAPFHAQRLLAVYGKPEEEPTDMMLTAYYALTYISGILYYLSTTINPVLYHIMSLKFRQAFQDTLVNHCGWVKLKKSHTEQLARRGGSWQQLRTQRSRTCSTSTQSERQRPGECGRGGGRMGRCPAESQRTRLVTVRCSNAPKPGELHSHSYYFPDPDLPPMAAATVPPARSFPPKLPAADPLRKVELYDVSAEEVIVYLEGGKKRGPVEVVLLPSPRRLSPADLSTPSSPSIIGSFDDVAVTERVGRVVEEDEEEGLPEEAPPTRRSSAAVPEGRETRGGSV